MKNLIMLLVKNFSNSRLILLFGALSWILVSCNSKAPTESTNETFVLSDTMQKRIEISSAEMQPVKAQLRLVGKIIADENKLVEVFPLVGGNVTDVFVELGDYVKQGQVLAIIKSGEIADFERQLIDAQSDCGLAQKNLKVAQDLFESKLASEKDVIAAKNEVSKANAELSRVKEVFIIYGIDKKSAYQVKAPISGFVIEKKINRDMQLRSDKSDNIFTIAEINDVWVNANVYESDISKIKADMSAEIKTLSYPDTTFFGKVDKIYNILDPQTKTMKVRVKLRNSDYMLKPEMNATVTLKYNEGGSMIGIPSSAIIFDKSKSYVMVYKDKYNIETREVDVYKQVGDVSYLKKGLNEGEKVISKNQLLIYDALND